jgi:hypothetical protein
MTDTPEIAAYVAALEAMLRPLAEREAAPALETVELLRATAWSHERVGLLFTDRKQRERADHYFALAAAIRARADALAAAQ